jgi:hypothetical protein
MRSWGTALIALLGAAFLSGPAGAAAPQSTGDTCVATGSGTSYVLTVTMPSGAPPQYGFAFGAPGASVSNVVIAGTEGTFSTQHLPAKSSGSWITLTAVMPGSVVADVTTTHAVTGSFTLTPANASTPAFYGPVTCAVAHASLPNSSFTVDRNLGYVAASHAWRLGVTIGGPGVVSAVEPEPTVATGASAQVTAQPLVQTRKLGLKSSGKVTLTLRLTPRGDKMIATSGSVRVRLEVTFSPKDGKSASKMVSLTLKKA